MANLSLEQLPHLVCVVDFQGHLKSVNSAWQVQLGLKADHLLVTNFTHWVHPDDIGHTQDVLSQLYSGQFERVVFGTRWRDRDQKYRWLFWAASVSLTDHLVYAVGVEMSAQEFYSRSQKGYSSHQPESSSFQSEQLSYLTQFIPLPPPFSKGEWAGFSEQRYQTIINGLYEGVIVYSADGKIRLCSPSAEKLLGRSVKHLLGQCDWGLEMVREDGSNFPKDLHPATVSLRTGKSCTHQVMGIYRPEGSFHWLSVHSQPLQLHSHFPPFAVVVTLVDISERKQVEVSLREKVSFFSSLFEGVKVGLAVTDDLGRFVFVNHGYCQMYGYRAEELLGQPFTMLLSPPLRQEALQSHAEFLAGNSEPVTHWQKLHHEDRVFSYLMTESLLVGVDDKRFKVTVVVPIDDESELDKQQAIDLVNNDKGLRLLLRHLPVTVLSLDRKGYLTFVEGQHLELLGLDSGVVGQSIFVVNQKKLALLIADFQRAVGGETFEKAVEFGGVTFKIKYMPLLKANKWVGALVVFYDITELRRLKLHLKKAIQDKEILASHSSVGLMYLDKQKIVRLNQQGAALLGYSPADLLKSSAEYLFRSTEDYIEFQQQAGMQLATASSYKSQRWLRRKNGSYIYCFVTVKTLKSNQVLWLLEKVSDSEKSKTHFDLQKALWDTASEAILIIDTQLQILEANSASAEFTGYTIEELLNQSLAFFNSGHQDESFYQQLREKMKQHGGWQGKVWQRDKNNAVYVCELKLQAFQSDDGVASRYVAVLGGKQSRNSAFLDPLTGLPSRQLFRHYLLRTVAQALRQNKFSAVLLIGIDDMAGINTKYGCALGDQFLSSIGQTLSHSVRDSDSCARYGADSFGVDLNEIAKPEDAGLVAQMLLFKLSQPLVLKGESVQCTVSIGMVVFPDDGDEVDILLELAEEAMQCAKQQGGGQCCFYNSVLQQQYLRANR